MITPRPPDVKGIFYFVAILPNEDLPSVFWMGK